MPTLSPFVSVSQLAAILGTGRSSLDHHIRKGHIAAPTHLVGRRRLYRQDEAEAIRAWWGQRIPYGVSRFTEVDVMMMKTMYEDGATQAEIGKRFGATQTHVSLLLLGRVLPGWRGGATGRGIARADGQKRRRNNKKVSQE